jgi:hypothetical protein
MFGSDRPITRTSLRRACRTASAAPGTAGAEIAITSATDGYTFMIVCVSANALSRSSSLGRMVASVSFGYFSASRCRMKRIHSF